ncbi:MAG: hypothetical protein WC346_07895 [Methanogenium sp.]
MTVQDSDKNAIDYWIRYGWTTTKPSSSGSTPASPPPSSNLTQMNQGSGMTLQSLLTYPKIANDSKLVQWIKGNASLIPKLASLGYNELDLTNEAYSWTRNNKSAFGMDMTTTPATTNRSYVTNPVTNISSADASSAISALQTGKAWGTVFDEIKAKYPSLSSDAIDQALQKDKWYNSGSYEQNREEAGTGSLVKFADSPTVFYVDQEQGSLIPFVSEEQFEERYKENVDAAWKSIETIEKTDPRIAGLTYSKETFTDTGDIPKVDTSTKDISKRYGNTNDEGKNLKAYTNLNAFLRLLQADPAGSGVQVSLIDEIINDKEAVARYMTALSYGGYSLEDVYRDVKRKQLVKLGDTSMADKQVISFSMNKSEYSATDAGREVLNDTKIQLPSSIKGLTNPSLLSLDIFQMPDELYKELVPTLDPTTDEGKALIDSMKTMWYDQAEAQINATTEQEKMAAEADYQEWKKNMEDSYGIQLSNNALEAWDQIVALEKGQAQRGIAGSGIASDELDAYLKKVRRQDQLVRKEEMTKEESQESNYYKTVASSAEIKKLIDEDPEKAKKYGLVPSAETLAALTPEALKAKYPEATDEQIANYRKSIVDEYGNYYSTLYGNRSKALYGDATTNNAGLYATRQTEKEGLAQQAQAKKEKEAYATFDYDTSFSNAVTGNENIVDPYKKAQDAASNITATKSQSDVQKTSPAITEDTFGSTTGTTGTTPASTDTSDEMVTIKNKTTGKTKKVYASSFNSGGYPDWTLA